MSLEIHPVSVRLENVSKYFGSVVAVDNVSLSIEKGEFFTILGPSGCGKSTTLRVIAGFEVPDTGRVFFDDEDVTFKKPYERDTAMVFQNYALWPHMTVYDNIAYGLRVRKKKYKLSEEDIRRLVKQVLELVRLEGLEKRYPLQLSGGQQQRVALARALVVRPRVLLLDEPLSNLDAKLRIEMREELKRIQRSLKITTIYVTHDQVEALSMSDRIAVMNAGRVMQVGRPDEVYFKPRNLFVAEFLGRSNIFEGHVVGESGDYVIVRIPEFDVDIPAVPVEKGVRGKVAVVIRPEILSIGGIRSSDTVVFKGVVDFKMFIGDKLETRVRVGKTTLLAYLPNYLDIQIGSPIELSASARNIITLPLSK
ncbi:ABC transporter ATP-binding protein [Thermogladius sp. 4427co]|uniref:ABC transporter ATP-binding protein n=1 Tax=Thermogladius sp. 4427co TaxID=3450718 RepID=UPI003F7A8686